MYRSLQSTGWLILLFVSLSLTSAYGQAAWQENFDDGTWTTNWQVDEGGPSTTTSTVHSAPNAIALSGGCHASLHRISFLASTGYYTAWANQLNPAAGFAVAIQMQSLVSNPWYGDGYIVAFQAANAQAPSGMNFFRVSTTGTDYVIATLPVTFNMNEWVQIFIRRLPSDEFHIGYDRGGVRDSVICSDPNPPITTPGFVYLWGCSASESNRFDDVAYDPWQTSLTPNHENPLFAGTRCLNGTDDYVNNPLSSLNNLASGCVEIWAMFNSISGLGDGEQFLITRSKFDGASYVGDLRLAKERINVLPDSGKFYFSLNNGNTRLYSTTRPVPGIWYHVAATWNGVSWSIYVNGVLENSLSNVTILPNDPNMLVHLGMIEGASSSYQCHFNGEMDEVRFSDRQRVPTEFALTAPSATDGNTLGLWHIDDLAGPTVADASSNGNHGTAYGTGCANPNTLIIPSVTVRSCKNSCVSQPVVLTHTDTVSGITVALDIPSLATSICSVSFAGTPLGAWSTKDANIQMDSGFISVYALNTTGVDLLPGTDTLFHVWFTSDRLCNTDQYIHWDTALSSDIARQTLASNASDVEVQVAFYRTLDSATVIGYEPGDVDDNGSVNVVDLTKMVCRLFGGCPPFCWPKSADVNASCTFNIVDLTYLVSRLFQGGAAPQCGCLPLAMAKAAPEISDGVNIRSVFDGRFTSIMLSTTVSLSGIELLLSAGSGDAATELLIDGQYDLLVGNEGNKRHIGLLDLRGESMIPAGVNHLIRVEGKVSVESAIGSDAHCNEVGIALSTAKSTMLPAVFALSQNYPNPFNPVTHFQFALPSATDMRLEIYNTLGQRVATLVDGRMEAGSHVASWDASAHASGVYLYRLTAGDFVETRKLVLLK
jgi:Concanavalin A-like lectin/glucanases superfamily/Secretion system C-terminal sorting domain